MKFDLETMIIIVENEYETWEILVQANVVEE